MKVISKVFSMISALCLSSSVMPFSAVAEEEKNNYQNSGLILMSAEEMGIPECKDHGVSLLSSLPPKVDNSQLDYFPDIGNQDEIGSCVAWATTYYQFTYEVNRYRGTSGKDPNNVYSPTWTYNYINGGLNTATILGDAYDVLAHQGAMKLNDMPYYGTEDKYSYEWSHDLEKMTEALKYRVDSYYHEDAKSSNDLTSVKQHLASGQIAVVSTNATCWAVEETTGGEKIVVRGSDYIPTGGHSIAVVGYDDNITVKFEKNGVTQEMKGAFKLANSYGKDKSDRRSFNNGYIWVAYDALNLTSTLTNNWERGYYGKRVQVFRENNPFYFIDVSYHDLYYVGKVTYASKNPWTTNIYGNLGTNGRIEKFTPLKYNNINITDSDVFQYKVVLFDYFDENVTSIQNYLKSILVTRITNTTLSLTSNVTFTVMDDLRNIIATNADNPIILTNGDYSEAFRLDLSKGRITHYDSKAVNSEDLELLSNVILGNATLSNLQVCLADMNDDSIIDVYDLILLRQEAINNDTKSFSLKDYVPEIGCSFEEYIENKLGESYSDFVAEYSYELTNANIKF